MMKTRRQAITFCLLSLSSFDLISSLSVRREVGSSAEGFELAKEASDISVPSASQQPTKPVVDGVGTKDAPVDGKDGRPHLGPFIETSAERDRKKAKESGDEMEKPIKKVSGKTASSEDGWKMPETNDGVMDDPNRTGPKEGTRGTEGGITVNTKAEIQEAKKESTEKTPDPPKEVPPLPHSEQKTLEKETGKQDDKKVKDGATQDSEKKKDDSKKDDKNKELGGLEVIESVTKEWDHADMLYRNQQTCLRSRTISLHRYLRPLQRPILLPSSSLTQTPYPHCRVRLLPLSSNHSTHSSFL